MKLIHRYDSKEDERFDEFYDNDKLITKLVAREEPKYKLLEQVYINNEMYNVTHISRSLYSEIRLVIELEKYQDYLDKNTLVKCEDGKYRTVKEQKEMNTSELTAYQQQIIGEIENGGVHKERVRGSFQKLVELHDSLLKRLKD
ncbi:hypothetical protein ACI3ER_11835 [Bacillus sp. Wb]